MRPSYDTPSYDQPYQGGEGYGSLNGAAQPGNAREQRQRRRESGMLLMNMGMQRNGNGHGGGRDARGNPLMVREETAFD